jgi:hypothetical protein
LVLCNEIKAGHAGRRLEKGRGPAAELHHRAHFVHHHPHRSEAVDDDAVRLFLHIQGAAHLRNFRASAPGRAFDQGEGAQVEHRRRGHRPLVKDPVPGIHGLKQGVGDGPARDGLN